MRFIHTGDIHWGMRSDANRPWGRKQVLAIRDTSRAIVGNAEKMDVGCLFISDDLFHRQSLMKDLKEVNCLFSTAPPVKAIIVVGDHDRIRDNSALLSLTWSSDAILPMDKNLTSAYFEDINTEVHGFNYYRAEIKEPLLDDTQVSLNSRIQTLIAHGGDPIRLSISLNSLEPSPSSYITLGHIHRPHIVVEGKMAYCGSPEPLDLTETDSHGCYMGEIRSATRKLLSLKFVPASSLQYVPLAVNMFKDTINGELSDRTAREIQNHREQNIYRFRLKGMRDLEIEFDLGQLSSCFKIAEIIDDPEPQYDFSVLFARRSSDITGFYIQALQKDGMSPAGKKALYYGVNALLRTTDERS